MTEPRMFLQKLEETGTAVRADMVSPDNKKHSIKEQCGLPGISSNAYYYEPRIPESRQMLMRRIDGLYTENPAAGQRSLQASLLRSRSCPPRTFSTKSTLTFCTTSS